MVPQCVNCDTPCVESAEMDQPFVCWNHTLIARHLVCDGTPHCAEGEDESQEGGCVLCDDDVTVISPYRLCDGRTDCPDGSDELLATCCLYGWAQWPRCKGYFYILPYSLYTL